MTEHWTEILMTTCNGADYVRAQLDSILAQKDGRWHLTVSDDGSTDATPDILDEYAARYPDKITRYRSGKRFGQACAHFLHLMGRCDAPYMLFSDQDDVWYPEKVGRMLETLEQAERQQGPDTPILVFSDLTPVDNALKPLASSMMAYQNQRTDAFDYRALLMQNVVSGGAAGINRALARLAATEQTDDVIMHDWWVAVTAARFGRIVYIPEALSAYRQHGGNVVGAQDVRSAGYVVRMLSSLGRVRRRLVEKKRQAALFSRLYAGRLSDEDAAFLRGFTRSHSGPWFYWRHRRLINGFWRLTGMMICG